ncbi:hypothetical protein E2C01_100783 [Portunus trituberculatus]|uniref:Uncharacterized protein n=1 Tax=Portunus trituberculatus TaxID=210409 RepID=A0A5B7K7T6_PORTR|nr:hypothetical protein [Portunus trituberculatus]
MPFSHLGAEPWAWTRRGRWWWRPRELGGAGRSRTSRISFASSAASWESSSSARIVLPLPSSIHTPTDAWHTPKVTTTAVSTHQHRHAHLQLPITRPAMPQYCLRGGAASSKAFTSHSTPSCCLASSSSSSTCRSPCGGQAQTQPSLTTAGSFSHRHLMPYRLPWHVTRVLRGISPGTPAARQRGVSALRLISWCVANHPASPGSWDH